MATINNYRARSRLEIDSVRKIIFGKHVFQAMDRIWRTLSNDSLLRHPRRELSLDEQRKLSFSLVKRLIEYDFISDEEILSTPGAGAGYILAFNPYDSSPFATINLHKNVRNIFCTLH